MTIDEVFPDVSRIIANHLNIEPEKIKLDTDFINDLYCDTLDIVESLMYVEDEYEVYFSSSDCDNVKTIRDVCELVCEYTKT